MSTQNDKWEGPTMNRAADIQWVRIPPPFGEGHPFGCCNAFVNGTACGWPRRADGSCLDGHPPMPKSAVAYSIHDLVAASRVSA